MQILVHVFVLEGILGSFLRGSDGCVQVLQLRGEAHTHFERVGHGGGGQMSLSVYVDAVYVRVYGLRESLGPISRIVSEVRKLSDAWRMKLSQPRPGSKVIYYMDGWIG